jgi:hypothetical protein
VRLQLFKFIFRQIRPATFYEMASSAPRVVVRNVHLYTADVKAKSGKSKKVTKEIIPFVRDYAGASSNIGLKAESSICYNFAIYASFHDVEEVVIRVERRTSADAPIQRKGPEFDELIKNVSFSGNAFLTCSLLFFNGKKSTVNRALGGSTYPG